MKVTDTSPESSRTSLEWPTLVLFFLCYLCWAGLLWAYTFIGYWVLPLLVIVTAFQSSLQHEALHGHPTRSSKFNEWLATPALSIWFPYRRYRTLHLRHHINERLTDPLEDPESWYLLDEQWSNLGPVKRQLLVFNTTLLGRLLIGPALSWLGFWRHELTQIKNGNRAVIQAWLLHLPGLVPVILALTLSDFPMVYYVLLVAYPATSLILIRSFIEHRAAMLPQARSAIVNAGRMMSLLYLNNNLHALHHNEPALAWYRLPERWKNERDKILQQNEGYWIEGGYLEVFKRWLLQSREPVLHPLPESLKRTPVQ